MIIMNRKISLRELNNAAVKSLGDSMGLFAEPEVRDVLELVNLDAGRSVRKIIRETGHFKPLYSDIETMTDTVTDFFIDNKDNILRADSVLNSRQFSPVENFSNIRETYVDETDTEHNIGERKLTHNTGKSKLTITPGDTTNESLENSKTTNQSNPRVLGSSVIGGSSTTSNTAIEGEEFSTKHTSHRDASTQEQEQLVDASSSTEAAKDTASTKYTAGKQHLHGNIGNIPNQTLATSELKYILQYKSTLDFIIKLFISECVIAVYDDDVNEYGYHYDLSGNPNLAPGTPGAFDPGPIAPLPLPDPLPNPSVPADTFTIKSLQSWAPNQGSAHTTITGGPFVDPSVLDPDNWNLFYPDGPKLNPGDHTLPVGTTVYLASDARDMWPYQVYDDGTSDNRDITNAPVSGFILTVRRNCTIQWRRSI